jgi:hypothetical protein
MPRRRFEMTTIETCPNEKVQAFFQEFPFLTKCTQPDYINAVSVQRIDSTLFDRRPELHWLLPDDRIFIFDGEGELLAVVEEDLKIPFWKRLLFFQAPESVREACQRLEIKDSSSARISFVVVLLEGVYYCGQSPSYVTVYKKSNNVTIEEWI